MSEFSERWSNLSKSQRRKVVNDMREKAAEGLSLGLRLRLTSGQLKAAAKTRVDMAIRQAKTA